MAGSFSLPTVLANLAAGNEALSLIDGDFTACYNPLVALGTFSNYYADTGAANAYVVTVSSPQTVSQAAGLAIQFLATNANTGASTLQINALAVKSIKRQNGAALAAGDIPAGGLVSVIFDGTNYQLQSVSGVINNIIIGATTPTTGAFTTLSVTQGAIISGTYTPTLSGGVNIQASTARVTGYLRVGGFVFVAGMITIDPTATALTQFLLDLPVASTLANNFDLGGTFFDHSGFASGGIIGDVATGKAFFEYTAISANAQSVTFNFGYKVL